MLIAWAFLKLFFSHCASFKWILTIKTHDLTDHQFTRAVFYLQSLPCDRIIKSQGDPILPAEIIFLCPASLIDLIVLQSPLFDFQCANPATPIAQDCLFLNVSCVSLIQLCHPSRAILKIALFAPSPARHWPNCFAKPFATFPMC